MSPVGAVIIYLLLWWVVLFAVLPMRVRPIWREGGDHPQGAERGAPVNPELWFKIKRTTWIAAIAWLVVAGVIASGVFEPDV